MASPEWAATLGDFRDKFSAEHVNVSGLSQIEVVSLRLGVHITVVPDGDYVIREVLRRGWRAPGALHLLEMRSGQGGTRISRWVKTAAKRAIAALARRRRRVRVFRLASSLSPGPLKRHEVRDPIQLQASSLDAVEFRKTWRMEDRRHWFAILGSITSRKNVPLVLSAIAASGLGDSAGVLLAGRVHPEVRQALAGLEAKEQILPSGVKLVQVDRLLSDIELDAAVLASDTLILAHSNEGPSGLVGKASLAGTQVLAAGAKSLLRDARAQPQLIQWCELNERDLTQQLKRRVSEGRSPAAGLTAANGEAFSARLLGKAV